MVDHRPIGVLDSGVGGLTVARELRNYLPNESIIYIGDNKNVPYGNRTEEEIAELARSMIDFLIQKDVKLVVVACNTVSTIIDKYFSDYDIPIVNIIKTAADYVVRNQLEEVGVIATKFTIATGAYDKLIKERDSSINIISEGSANLASLIDGANFTDQEVESLVDLHMTNILAKGDLKNIILGCTHYPIVADKFKERSPEINFIDPAYEEVMYVDRLLTEYDLRGYNEKSTFIIYTSGKKAAYRKMIDLLAMKEPDKIVEI